MPSINEIKSQWGVSGKKKKEEQKQQTPSIDVIKSQWDGSYEQKKNDAKTALAKKKDELIAFKGSDLERSAKEALYYKDAASYSNKWGTPAEYDNNYKAYLDAMGRVRSSYDAKLNEMNAADQRYIPAMSQERAAKLSAENAGRRYAEQAPVYEQMARDAAALGDKDLFDRAQGGYSDLSGKYGNAYAAYIQAMNDDYKQRMGDLEKSDKGRYLYQTTSKEDVDRRVKDLQTRQEELKTQMEEADLERRSMRNNPDLIWYDTLGRFEDNEAYREYDRVNGLYGELQAEEERLEQELAPYQRAKDLYDYDDYLALREQFSPGGGMTQNEWQRLRDEGERKYRAVHERADTEKQEAKQGVENTLLPRLSAYHALRMEKEMTEIEEDAGVIHDFDDARHLNRNDADIFYVLYAQDPEKAAEFIHTAKLQRDDEFQQYIADHIKDNPLARWNAGMQGGAVAHLIGGAANLLDPYSETALEINRVGNALSMGAAQGAEEHGIFNTGALAGKIDENTPVIGDILGGKGLGDAYQLGTSMVESGLTAMAAAAVGDYGDAVVKVVEFLGTAIMGSSAAASDYDECIKRGLDRQQAMVHATSAGIAEAAFEYISLDKLVNQDITRGLVKNFFLQGGIEASEEACTTIFNRITDGIWARRDGYDTSIEQRTKELMALGMDRKEAESKAEQEWLTELINDALGGFISGGFMTLGKTAMNWREYKAAREQNRQAGATARQTNQTDALQQYAEDNDLGWYGEKFDEDAPVIDLTEEDLFAGEDQSPAEQTKQTRQEKRKERQAQREQKRQLREQSKQDIQIGSDTQRVQAHIQEQFSGKSIQEQTQLRDQMIEKYGNGIAPAVYEAISVEAAKKSASLKSADEIRAARDQAVNETQDRAMKRAIADGYDQAVFGQAMRSGNADEAGRYFQQLRNTGEGGMTLEATVKDQDGQSRQIAITGMTEDGKGVKLADGSTVTVSKLRADADTMDAVQRIAELEMGADADAVLQAYIKADKQGVDGYRWLMDYSLAYEQGRTNKLSPEEAVKRSSLDQRTVLKAYALGQRNAHQETGSAMEALEAMPKKQGITGKTSNIDVSEIKGITLNESEREQFEFANKVFSLIGVDVKWRASAVKNGRFVGANGSYLNGVVTLDVHAGRNFLEQVNSGVLATMGHELTHFLQQYAPEQYQALKEFLFRQIVQSSANGETRLERLIWEKQRRASSKLSRKAAEDEVVADACQTMLRDSKAIREFAQQDEEAAKGVVRWLDKWFGKLKQAFSRSAQLTEEARFVDGLAQEVREAFGKLWDEALREAVETHDRVGNINGQQRQNSDRDTEYLELAKDPEKNAARLQEMVDERAREAGAMTLPGGKRKPYYHGTAAKFTSFDINKSGDGTFGYGFYFTPVKSFAQGYGPVKSYYIMTDRIATWEDHRITPEQVLQIRAGYGLKTGENDVAKVAKWLENTGDSNVMLSLESAIERNTNVRPAEFLQRFREVFGYDGLRQARETVLFDNRLIKSADPVTYDDSGNVIPLSERFNTENQDIRYSERDELASDNQVHDITNRSGETVGVQDGNGHVQFSQRTWRESGKEKMQEYLDERVRKYEANRNDPEGMHPDDAKALMAAVQEQYDALDEIVRQQPGNYKTYEDWADAEVETDIFGNPVFSWLKANGDYGISGDASLICVKRRTLDAVFDYMIQNNMIQDGPEGLKLAQESIVAINDIIRAHGFETACSTCYIDARRYRAAIVAGSFCNVYNKLVRSMLKGKTGVPINAFNFGGNKSVTPLANSLDTLSDSEINWDGINKAIRDQEAKWESKGWEKFTEDGEEKWRRNGTVKNLPTSGTTEYRIALALKEKPSLRKLALRSDFLSGNGFLELNRTNKDILTLYNVKKGQAGPKATETDIQYLHEALENSFITPERMFKAGGFRLQSFSDYVPRLVFDYVEIIGDLAAKGVPAHMYTKEILCVLQHGLTGTKINMSLIPAMVKKGIAPGLDADGNYLWRDGQTFGSTAYSLSPKLEAHLSKILGYQVKGRLTGAQGFELAKLIQNDPAYGKNNGTIAIGVSEAQIRKMLDDADIRMVIPYHKSGLNHILASMMEIPGFENYESYQNTLKWNGTKWSKVDVDFDFNEAVQKHNGDARAAAQDYLDWCEENGYKPKFSGVASGSARNSYNKAYDFTQHADWQTGTMTGEAESNYYKVLADFTCYDAEGKVSRQEAVKLNYPGTDSAFGSMKQLIEMGLESDAMLQAKQDAEVPKIVADIRREIPKFEAAGRSMKAYAQLKENVQGRQFSERDYDLPSDLELMDRAIEGLSEAGGEEYWKALLETDPGLAEDVNGYKDQAEKLAAAEKRLADYKKQMQLGGNRKLNTTGIPSLALKMMKDLGASDAKGRGVAKKVVQTLTNAYQKALDSIDKGMDDSSAFEIVYNEGVVPAAEIIAKQGTHSEKTGRGWITTSLESYYGEGGLQSIIDTVAGYVGADYALNRYRKAIQPTVADRIVERTEKRMQKQVDAATERATEAERINKKLTEDRDFWKNQQAKDSETVTFLNERLKEARQDLRDNKSLSSQERRKLAARIKSLQTQLQAKREEIRALKSLSQQLDKQAVEFGQKQAKLLDKLEKQVQRERDILAGKLKPLGMQRLLKDAREQAAKKAEQHKDEVFQNYKERRQETELRNRIKNLRAELANRIARPTDRVYVPAALAQSLVDVLDTLDASPRDGTKAAAKYASVSESLRELARSYGELSLEKQNEIPWEFKSEYQEDIAKAIEDLEKTMQGRNLRELSADELQQVYDVGKRIRDTMRNATKLIGQSRYQDMYEAGDSVIANQREIQQRKNDKNAAAQKVNGTLSAVQIDALSAIRAAHMIGGFGDSAIYQLWKDIEDGLGHRNFVSMEANKRLQSLKSGNNEATYLKALRDRNDYGLRDVDGRIVKLTKMQAMQIYMTWQREASNDKLAHMTDGGVIVRNAELISKGKYDQAEKTKQKVKVDQEAISKIFSQFTEWDNAYMQAARDVFDSLLKQSNEVLYALKKKVHKGEKNYIPERVAENYLQQEVVKGGEFNLGIKEASATKDLVQRSTLPIIIDGLETLLNHHINEMSNYIGLAVPIRNFAKVYNMRTQGIGVDATTVNAEIANTWGRKAGDMMMDTLRQLQNGKTYKYETSMNEAAEKLQSGFVKSSLVGKISVFLKQAASYASGGSVLSQRALDFSQQYIYALVIAPNSKMARRIYERIDALTAEHYIRRQGMSMEEIAMDKLSRGFVKDTWNKAGAWLEGKGKAGQLTRRGIELVNPTNWIQRMDVATTAALFIACEKQARYDGFKPGTAEYDAHLRELYERVIRETQPMYDALHRPELQKNAPTLVKMTMPFRTVPFQNYGQIMDSVGMFQEAMRNGTKAQKTEAAKHLGKTLWANFESAAVFALLGMVAQALRHKPKKYLDEDEELTFESALHGYLGDVLETSLGNLLPYGGSEMKDIVERLISGDKWYDVLSVGAVDLANNTIKSIVSLRESAEKLQNGDITAQEMGSRLVNTVMQFAKFMGVPAENMVDIYKGVSADVKDLAAGKLSIDRSNAVNARRYFKAWQAGDANKMNTVMNELKASTSDDADKIRNAVNGAFKTAYETDEISLDEYTRFIQQSGLFDAEKQKNKVRDLAKAAVENGEMDENTAIAYLTGTGLYDEDAAWKTVQRWEAGAEHEGEEDYSYSQYEDLREALDAGKSLEEAGKDYLDHGYTEEQIAAQAVSWLKDQVTAGEINEDRAIQLLRQYKGMDADKAWKKVQEWKAKAEHAEDEDYSWSQYDEIDAAIDGNKDIKALVKELTDHGTKEKDVTSHVKSYLIQRYENKAITESQFRNQLSRYCGIVAKKDVDEIVNNANCFRDSGFHYSELKTAYNAKELSGDKARQMLIKYGGLSKDEAKQKTRFWDFEVQHPDANLSIEKVNAYYDTRPANNGKTMEQAGISVQSYISYCQQASKATGTDKDGDGRTDSGSKKAAVMRIIDSLKLTRSQKDALYYLNGWSAKTINEAPWH